MRVFITGGTGFFGRSIQTYLKANHPEVETVILSRSQVGKGFVSGTIDDCKFPEGPFDYVLHMQPGAAGTNRLIRFVDRVGAKVLFTSSGAVYSHQTEYACQKRTVETVLSLSQVPWVIARCFAFVGPSLPLNLNFAIGNFIRDALSGGPIVVKGNSIRSYLYTSDLAEWLWTMLTDSPAGEIYDVGSDEAISTPELAQVVRDVLNLDAEILITGMEGTTYLPDLTKAHALGLRQKVGLKEAIKRTAEEITEHVNV